MEVCGIIFKENGKNYYFNKNNIEININDYVIVETEKGEQFGKVAFNSKLHSDNLANGKPISARILKVA